MRLRRKVDAGEEVNTASVDASVAGALQHPQMSRRAALPRPYILSAISRFSSVFFPLAAALALLSLSVMNISQSDFRRSSWSNKVRSRLFTAIYESYSCFSPASSRFHRITPVLLSLYDVICMMSLQVHRPEERDSAQLFVKVLQHLRMDYLAASQGLLMPFVCVHVGLVLWGILAIGIRVVWPGVKSTPLRLSTTWVLNYIQHVAYTPILISLEAYIQVWVSGRALVYSDFSPPSYSHYLGPAALLTIPVLLIQVFIGVLFGYSLLYSPATSAYQARSRSLEYLIHKTSRLLLVTVFVLLVESGKVWVAILFLILGVSQSLMVLLRLPFYSPLCNSLLIWQDWVLAWTAFVVTLGTTLDSDATVTRLLLVVSPVLLVISYCEVNRRTGRMLTCQKRDTENITNFDYACRRKIEEFVTSKGKDIETIRALFRRGAKKQQLITFVTLLEANFYLTYLEDADSARKCLARLSWLRPSLEEQFQLFRIQRETSNTDKELRYLELLSSIRRLREMDFNLCFHIYDLVQELLSSAVQPRKCDRLAGKIAKASRIIQAEGYASLVQFPSSADLLYLYGSFMHELMRDSAGFIYLEKARSLRESLLQGRSPDSLNGLEMQPALCMSCHPSSLGEIHYINEKALELFGLEKSEVRDLHVGTILPACLETLCERLLKEVLVAGLSMGNIVRFFSFVLNEKEFNPLVRVQAKVLFWQEIPYFFVSFQPDADKIAIVLFNGNCIIQSHSERLNSFLPLHQDGSSFKNCYLFDLFPDLPLNLLSFESGTQVSLTSSDSAILLFEHIKLGKETFYALTILSSEVGKLLLQRALAPWGSSTPFSRNVRFHETSEMITILNQPSMELDSDPVHPAIAISEQHSKNWATTGPLLMSTSTTSSPKAQSSDAGLKAEQGCRRLKLLLLVSIGILVLAATATALFLMQKTEAMKGVEDLEVMSQRRSMQIQMANAVRRLQLQAAGLDLGSAVSTRLSLLSLCGNYSQAISSIKAEIASWPNGPAREMYFKPSVLTMERRGNAVFPIHLDLFQAMYGLLARCYLVANSEEGSVQDGVTDEQYFILRNAPAEMYKAVNESMFLLIQDNLAMREDAFEVAEGLFVGMGAVACFCYFFLLLPQVLLLERTNRQIWCQLYSLPFDKLVEVKHRIFTRLQSFHSLEMADFEASSMLSTSPKSGEIVTIWQQSMAKLACIGVLTALVLLGVGLGVYGDMKAVLRTVPNYMNWGELRSASISAMHYWLKEAQLHTLHRLNYHQIFSSDAFWPQPNRQFLHSLAFTAVVKQALTNVSPQYGIYRPPAQAQYINFRMNNACAEDNPVPDCSDKVFQQGFLAAGAEIAHQFKHFYMQINQQRANWSDFAALEGLKDDFLTTSSSAIRLYKAENDVNVQKYRSAVLVALLSFAGALLLVYFLWLSWDISSLSRILNDRNSVLKLLNEG